jgi:radical SAM protein with 4Fe4S-binding SPASM domain
MSIELFQKIARSTFPITRALYLSIGAEPLMAKAFPDMLDVVGRYRIPEVSFITNGTLLNRQIIDRLIRGGVTSILVSVDGADPETFGSIRRGAKFQNVVDNLRLMQQIKEQQHSAIPGIRFSVTLMRKNIEQLPAIVRLAKDLGVESIHASHMVLYKGLNLQEESLIHYKTLTNECLDEARKQAENFGITFFGPSNFNDPESLVPSSEGTGKKSSKECNFPWTEFFIFPDGKVRPCCFWYDASRMGDFNTQSFKKIWKGKEYKRLREELKTGRMRKTCLNCPLNKDSGSFDDQAFIEQETDPDS